MGNGNRRWHSSKRIAENEIKELRIKRQKNDIFQPPTQKQILMLTLFEEIAAYYKIPCEKTMESAYTCCAAASHAIRSMRRAFERKGLSNEKIMAMYYKRLKVAMDGQTDLDRQRHMV